MPKENVRGHIMPRTIAQKKKLKEAAATNAAIQKEGGMAARKATGVSMPKARTIVERKKSRSQASFKAWDVAKGSGKGKLSASVEDNRKWNVKSQITTVENRANATGAPAKAVAKREARLTNYKAPNPENNPVMNRQIMRAAGSTISAGMGGSFLDSKTKKFKQGKLR